MESVDKSLDQLLEKFDLLNINTLSPKKDQKKNSRNILDAKQVFKSTIIQFAVTERAKNERRMLEVTPIKRSTRKSKSGYILTPGIKICTTFSEVEDISQGNVIFKTNKQIL